MKVAIIGNGRQGKKHKSAWEKYGVFPHIFSRYGSEDSRIFLETPVSHLIDFHCIIVAVSPISEQELVLKKLLSTSFRGILIIEKPVCNSLDLLMILVNRKNTLFFIDEVFISELSIVGQDIDFIEIGTNNYEDYINVYEHAIGWFLGCKNFASILNIPVKFFLHDSMSYRIFGKNRQMLPIIDFEAGQFPTKPDQVFEFNCVYSNLIKKLRDEDWLINIRINYYSFRLFQTVGNN